MDSNGSYGAKGTGLSCTSAATYFSESPKGAVQVQCVTPSSGEVEEPMASHKFKIGEIVTIRPALSRNVPGGLYEVTKQLPHNGREFEYRIKSVNEPHERVAGESELTRD